MSKVKTAFFCQNCGTQYSKWQGQCNACKEWNTIVEELVQKEEKVAWKTTSSTSKAATKPLLIKEIDTAQEIRMNTTDNELNRVLGGGLVPGSLTLLGGEPGIGKSTLLLQIALKLPYKTWGIIYIYFCLLVLGLMSHVSQLIPLLLPHILSVFILESVNILDSINRSVFSTCVKTLGSHG